jgi:hypothetical protein
MAIDVERFLRDEADKAAVWSMDCYNIRVLTMSDLDHIIIKLAALVRAESSPQAAPLTDSYVQEVPDKCDRIVWRNRYYHLPNIAEASRPAATPEAVKLQRIQRYLDEHPSNDDPLSQIEAAIAALSAHGEGK